MKTYTPEEQKENLRKGCEALRANEKKAKRVMQDGKGGRCCLCVLAHVAEDIDEVARDAYVGDTLPSERIGYVFGMQNHSYASFNTKIGDQTLTSLNDGVYILKELSHAEIADLIEKEYLL